MKQIKKGDMKNAEIKKQSGGVCNLIYWSKDQQR